MEKTFPSAKVRKPHPKAQGFKVADGSNVADRGSADLPARTQEGEQLSIHWNNAKVAMPILSTNRLATGGKGVWYHEHGVQSLTLKQAQRVILLNLVASISSRSLCRRTLPSNLIHPKLDPMAGNRVLPGRVLHDCSLSS